MDELNQLFDINLTFKQKCCDNGINYKTAWSYKKAHPKLTESQIINIYLAHKIFNFNTTKYTELNKIRYYSCVCIKCNLKTILTVDEMLEHSKICKE